MKKRLLDLVLPGAISLLVQFSAVSQSIKLNLNSWNSYCTGDTLKAPVTLSGNWGSDNQFVLRLKATSGYPDTTIIVPALNNNSSLLFKLPKLYANEKVTNQYSFTATVEASSPVSVSNQVSIGIRMLSAIKLGEPQQILDYSSIGIIPNNYMNLGYIRKIPFKLYHGDMHSNEFGKWNDSSTVYLNVSEITLSPSKTKTYQLVKIWNACGEGKVLPSPVFTIKVNPFKVKIVDLYPRFICEDRKVYLNIDYAGMLDSHQLYVEVVNEKGDTLRRMPTTIIDEKQLLVELDDRFSIGNYLIRVRCDNPDLATDYKPLSIIGPPKLELTWFAKFKNDTIGYKNQVVLGIRNTTTFDNNRTVAVRLSDGTVINQFTDGSGGATLYPTKSNDYKVASVITQICGVSKNFSVTGERKIIVREDFYVQDIVKKQYCEGDKVRFRIKSSQPFGTGNNFTVLLSIENKTTQVALPATIIDEDSLEFTLPDASVFQNSFWSFTFQVQSSNPSRTSTSYWRNLEVARKPILVSLPEYLYPLPFPMAYNAILRIAGGSPGIMTLSDGEKLFTTPIDKLLTEASRELIIPLLPLKTTTYQIKSIENVCGRIDYDPAPAFTIEVPDVKKTINLTQIPSQVCKGSKYKFDFKTTGEFAANDEFIVRLTYRVNDSPVTVEVGRGQSSPITIQIPDKVTDGSIRFTITSSLSESENLLTATRYSDSYIINSQSVYLTTYLNSNNSAVVKSNVEVIAGDEITSYISANTVRQPFDIKFNDTWYNYDTYKDQYDSRIRISFRPVKDTLVVMTGLRNACGVMPLNDSLLVKVKPYRMKVVPIYAGARCQGNLMDVAFSVEGATPPPTDYKIYFAPYLPYNSLYTDSLKVEAQIVEKTPVKYTVRIPDMPYEGMIGVLVVPVNGEKDYARNYVSDRLYLVKKHQVKLTAKNGSDVAWYSGNDRYVSLKIETLNSNNPSWTGYLDVFVSNNFFAPPISSGSSKVTYSSVVAWNGDRYKLVGIESECGFGTALGEVTLKQCHDKLNLPYYSYYNSTNEWYSQNSIKSQVIVPLDNTLYSASQSIELLPGFKADGQKVFKAEIGGCKVEN